MANVSFQNLSTNADKLRSKLKNLQQEKENKSNQTQSFDDWKFKPDLIGQKSTYVLRILPNIHKDNGESEPWIKTLVHMFPTPQGLKKFALCPKTLDEKAPCPLCDKAKALFVKVNDKSASKTEEDAARKFYKKPRYFANVLVLDDPRTGEKCQKGKVLVWEFGQQIFDRLFDALVDRGLNFYDPKEGNNFQLVIKKKGDYPNYESSFFDSASTSITSDEAEFNSKYANQIHNIEKKALGKGPKSYAELKDLMEGKEPEKKEKEWDSNTGETVTKPLNKPDLNENIDIEDVKPSAKVAAPVNEEREPDEPSGDEDLLAQLDSLGADLK